jgi:hypothetical protein
MRSLFFLYFLLAFSAIAPYAQGQARRPFCGFSLKNGYYYKNNEVVFVTREARIGDKSGIPDVVESIKKQIGTHVQIAVFIEKVGDSNCFATIGAGGKRLLIVDQFFLDHVNKVTGTDWSAISILAHEIGHHIAGFSRRDSQLDAELDADYWSGYFLEKLGASEEESTRCIMTFGTEADTDSHPSKYSRRKAIQQGWTDAKEDRIDSSRCDNCITE